jgi:hypothetical protein
MRAMTRRETCHPVREADKGRREKKSRRSTLTGFACQHSNSAEFFSTHAAMLCPCCRGINAQKRSILHCCPLDCINVRCCAYMPSLVNHSSCEPAMHFWTRASTLPQPAAPAACRTRVESGMARYGRRSRPSGEIVKRQNGGPPSLHIPHHTYILHAHVHTARPRTHSLLTCVSLFLCQYEYMILPTESVKTRT